MLYCYFVYISLKHTRPQVEKDADLTQANYKTVPCYLALFILAECVRSILCNFPNTHGSQDIRAAYGF